MTPNENTSSLTERLRRYAFHEAGHAVAAWSLGHNVGGVRIDERGGQADVRHPDGADPIEKAIVALAGGQADNLLLGDSAEDLPGAIKDETAAIDYIEKRTRNSMEKLAISNAVRYSKLRVLLSGDTGNQRSV